MSENCRLRIYKSNRLENFLPEVCKIIKRLAEDAPLKKKDIIVQSDGMARWLTLKAASDLGVFANFDFVSPDGFLKKFAEKHFGITRDSVYNKKNAEWALYSLLRSGKSGYAGKYVGGNEARAFRFCRTLADLFEQYFVYRPGMMKCWREGSVKTNDSDEFWQFEIFRKLAELTETRGFAQLFKEKCSSAPENGDYPKELILFGISIENKYHLDMFGHLSRLFPVHLFSMSPSQAYFSVSKEKGDFKKFGKDFGFSPENLPDTFFGRFCAAGIDFFNFVLDGDLTEIDSFKEPEDKTLLASLQRDILNDTDDPEKAENDGSVKIISCRDKMREIEVLKDNLLELFKDETLDLKPEDVAVMAPAINDYVPYITAVFGGTDPKDTTFIPWVISDRTFSSESRIAATFLEMLRLVKSDFGKSKVLSIFRSPCVCRKFGADDKAVAEIEKLIDESGVRRGLGADPKGEKRDACSQQNTWDFGLSRIMMSFFMPFPEKGDSFECILPMESVSKETLENISGFVTFARELFLLLKKLSLSDKTPVWFKEQLENALDFFFAYDRNDGNAVEEVRYIRNVIDDFAETADAAVVGTVSFEALLQYLEDELGRERSGRGFLSAKINFCSLKPLRALPFKVIYLIGMGDGGFPRTENRYSFDLTQKRSVKEKYAPLPRSMRDSDKYLFAEAIVSARKKLFISYEAKDLSEDSKKHCSAALPVQILEKYIEKKTGVKADELEIKYPVQPFSGEYFKDESPFKTFSKKDFALAHAMFHVEQNPQDLLPERVPEESEICCESTETEIVDLEKLIRFFKDPVKFYLTRTLGIALPGENRNSGDEELFEYGDSDALLKYDIGKTYIDMARMMPEEFEGEPGKFGQAFVRRISGEGKMPLGVFGKITLEGLVGDSSKQFSLPVLAGKTAGKKLENHEISLCFPEISLKLTGMVLDIDSENSRMILVCPSKFKEKYQIGALIRHLAVNACGIVVDTEFCCYEEDVLLKRVPPDEAKIQLTYFLELWKSGKKSLPLFDPEIIGKLRKKMFPNKTSGDAGGGYLTDKTVKDVITSFFKDRQLKRNDERVPSSQEHLVAAEQFFYQDCFLREFPTAEVLEICRLLERFYSPKQSGNGKK